MNWIKTKEDGLIVLTAPDGSQIVEMYEETPQARYFLTTSGYCRGEARTIGELKALYNHLTKHSWV